MARQADTSGMATELAAIPGTSLKVSPVALGTWAIGGWVGGGNDEAESISTIRAALEHGINVIETAPLHGLRRAAGVGRKAKSEGAPRARVLTVTKARA